MRRHKRVSADIKAARQATQLEEKLRRLGREMGRKVTETVLAAVLPRTITSDVHGIQDALDGTKP